MHRNIYSTEYGLGQILSWEFNSHIPLVTIQIFTTSTFTNLLTTNDPLI